MPRAHTPVRLKVGRCLFRQCCFVEDESLLDPGRRARRRPPRLHLENSPGRAFAADLRGCEGHPEASERELRRLLAQRIYGKERVPDRPEEPNPAEDQG